MGKGIYVLKIEDHGEEVKVKILGGLGTEEIDQVFGFCVNTLLDNGADVDELHDAMNIIKEERNGATV